MSDVRAVRDGIVDLGRRVVEAGLVVAAGGNIAARGSDDGGLVVTPSGWSLADLDADRLCTVSADGVVVVGGPAPTTELRLHVAALGARPDSTVSLHVHPPAATLLHVLGIPIRRITTDHAYYVRRIAEVGYVRPGSEELADATARAVADADIVLLRHHGCLVVADSFDLAFSRAVNLEAAAIATYGAARLGVAEPPECPTDYVELD